MIAMKMYRKVDNIDFDGEKCECVTTSLKIVYLQTESINQRHAMTLIFLFSDKKPEDNGG